MHIYKQYTTYNVDGTIKSDIDFSICRRYKNILFIATREAQINRINDFIYNKQGTKVVLNKTFTFAGWWELKEFGLIKDGKISVEEWKKYDAVIFLDPNRASNTKFYLSIIEKVIKKCSGQFVFVQ